MGTTPAARSQETTFQQAGISIRKDGRQVRIDCGRRKDEMPAVEEGSGSHDVDTTPDGEEQRITSFSSKARRRLRKTLHSVRRDARAVFVTLTYHETDPTPFGAKDHLDTFVKRLFRWLSSDMDGVCSPSLVWKMEPQERGVPHFHLLIYGTDFVPVQKLSRIWHESTGESSRQHLKAGVDVESAVNEDGKLQGYLSKYMGKTYEQWPGEGGFLYTGRWWGVRGRSHLPVAEWSPVLDLDRHEAEAIIRALLDEWEVDMPSYAMPPSLEICTRGDPYEWLVKNLP